MALLSIMSLVSCVVPIAFQRDFWRGIGGLSTTLERGDLAVDTTDPRAREKKKEEKAQQEQATPYRVEA
jgi:hypothetical protein